MAAERASGLPEIVVVNCLRIDCGLYNTALERTLDNTLAACGGQTLHCSHMGCRRTGMTGIQIERGAGLQQPRVTVEIYTQAES